jgi:hypothetical protein
MKFIVMLLTLAMSYVGYQTGGEENPQRWAAGFGILPILGYTIWYLCASPDIYGEKIKKVDEKSAK